ncbi:GRIN2-like protein [Notolabrus celidotus]|uniref:GRIN2-like protein n=1 Tax=Notolabrus celidotus TaxID=1203425 RepID=UPI00148FC83F|nr:GRIN2-like protein [Notolabrus celidotus]
MRVSSEPGEKDCVPSGASSLHQSPAEMQTASHQHGTAMSPLCENSKADRTMQSSNPTSLPVHRSHSVTSPMIRHGVPHRTEDHGACGLTHQGGANSIQEADIHSVLSCKQCSIMSTFPCGANTGEGRVALPQNRCVCMMPPKTAGREEGYLPATCDRAHCCGSYINHANFEDTFAAYCHPQPIPAPSQLLQRLPGPEPSCDLQRAVEPPSAINHLTLPRLISSVSETGLDAKHLLHCCNLNCSWMSTLPPGAGPGSQKHFGLEETCSRSGGLFRTATRDMGTMTANKELRDVGVQTGQTVTPHVFPEICLAEDTRSEISRSQSNTDSSGDKKPSGTPKSPVKEVKWDAEGMTWEVYGASVDPEELGLAIQKHLELQIKETAKHAAKLSRQNTNTSRQSRNNGCQRKRSRMIGSFRPPACCARTTTAVD